MKKAWILVSFSGVFYMNFHTVSVPFQRTILVCFFYIFRSPSRSESPRRHVFHCTGIGVFIVAAFQEHLIFSIVFSKFCFRFLDDFSCFFGENSCFFGPRFWDGFWSDFFMKMDLKSSRKSPKSRASVPQVSDFSDFS